ARLRSVTCRTRRSESHEQTRTTSCSSNKGEQRQRGSPLASRLGSLPSQLGSPPLHHRHHPRSNVDAIGAPPPLRFSVPRLKIEVLPENNVNGISHH
ncbi:unnamed protein product, partial [Musa acuminata subsp. burmannicoides]